MVAFQADDARFFYGREAEIRQMLRHLRHSRFLLVVGPSGSGKSSLIHAGLLPALEQSSYWHTDYWHPLTMRPGPLPADALAELLGSDLGDPHTIVAHYLASYPPAERLLLILDQFEEVFAQADHTEQHRFTTMLKELHASENCAVLPTLRADFYADLMVSELWPVAPSERIDIAPLRGEALRLAIEQPAVDVGVCLEGGLVERLLADAADEPGSLPLLQETLVLMWDRMVGRTLPLSAYEELGGARRTGLAVAVATKADAVMAGLTEPQQGIARRIFLRLVQFGEGRPDTRRQQPADALRATGEDPELFDETLGVLADNRLLTLGESQDGLVRAVDLAHEALIKDWPTLQAWLIERREAEQTRRRLEDKAVEWVRLGRSRGGLLDESELPETERWLSGPDAMDMGNSAELLGLVKASRTANEEAERTREAALERELALEKARRGAAEARSRLAIGAGLLILLIALAVGLGALFLQANADVARKNAEIARESRTTRAQVLAEQSGAQLDIDPDLSLLLAMEAVSTTLRAGEPAAPKSASALRQALTRSPVRMELSSVSLPASKARIRPTYGNNGHLIVGPGYLNRVTSWDATHVTGEEIASLRGHTDDVISAAYSPNSDFLVTASSDMTARIWDTRANSTSGPRTLTGHTAPLTDATFSPDGHSVVTASQDGTARVWDASTGATRMVLRGSGSGDVVNSAVYSPDGRYILTSSEDRTARLWDSETGQAVRTLTGHAGGVTDAAYSPDGRFIVTASRDGTGRIWDATTGQSLHTLQGGAAALWSAAYRPDGRRVVTGGGTKDSYGGSTGQLTVWDAETGQPLRTLSDISEIIGSVSYSPDGRFILTSPVDTAGGAIKVWDPEAGQEHPSLGGTDHAAYSPDGRFVVTVGVDMTMTATIWDAMTGGVVHTLRGHTDYVKSVDYSPDGHFIVTSSNDKTVRVWDAGTGQLVRTLEGPTDEMVGAGYTGDGRRIVAISWIFPLEHYSVWVWSADTGQLQTTWRDSHKLWAADGEPNKLLVTTLVGGQVKIWDINTGQLIRAWQGDIGNVRAVDFSPDGHRLVGGGSGGAARVWDVQSGQILFNLTGHSAKVTEVAYSPDAATISTASDDASVKLWDARTGQLLHTMCCNKGGVRSIDYSPDSHYIVTAGTSDGSVKVWNVQTGEESTSLSFQSGSFGAQYSPDGRTILVFGSSNSYQLAANIADLMALAAARVHRSFTPQERAQYLGEPGATPSSSPNPSVTATGTSIPTERTVP